MYDLKYLANYSPQITSKVHSLIESGQLGEVIMKRYPEAKHSITSDKALYDYTIGIKNEYLKKTQPLSKVAYDDKISVINQSLGLHTHISRVQGKKLKSKNEIKIASVFKKAPIEFLKMIVVHELAHLKEKDHDKAFYSLCEYMEPSYHQLEFDLRLYLTHLDFLQGAYKN